MIIVQSQEEGNDMDVTRIIGGYAISMLGGAIALWLTVDKLTWGYLKKKGIPGKKAGILTAPVGVVERLLYTTSFLVNQPGFVAVWLALKVASQWKRWEGEDRATYNVFLIGNGLSMIMAYLGAWVATGDIPLTK